MSFTSNEVILVDLPCDSCFDALSKADVFTELMSLSDITDSVKVISIDEVHLSPDLAILEIHSSQQNDTETIQSPEKCVRINFELYEKVTYLGIAKLIPVLGYLIISRTQKLHVEHRVASAGLVVTDKVRRFRSVERPILSEQATLNPELTGANSLGASTKDGHLTDNLTTASTQQDQKLTTEIVEEIIGSTSWYLKYFVELEARRSHKAIMSQYPDYLSSKHNSI